MHTWHVHVWPHVKILHRCLPQVIHKVVIEHKRPDLPYSVPTQVAQLAADCWQQNPDARPSFQQLVTRLEDLNGNVEQLLAQVHQAEQGSVTDF